MFLDHFNYFLKQLLNSYVALSTDLSNSQKVFLQFFFFLNTLLSSQVLLSTWRRRFSTSSRATLSPPTSGASALLSRSCATGLTSSGPTTVSLNGGWRTRSLESSRENWKIWWLRCWIRIRNFVRQLITSRRRPRKTTGRKRTSRGQTTWYSYNKFWLLHFFFDYSINDNSI